MSQDDVEGVDNIDALGAHVTEIGPFSKLKNIQSNLSSKTIFKIKLSWPPKKLKIFLLHRLILHEDYFKFAQILQLSC